MTDFDSLYRRYWPDVLRFSLYLCGDAAEAEDLTAEAFVRAWTSTRPIRVGTVKAYLFLIVRNLYRDRLRRTRRRRDEHLDERVPDRRPGPEVAAANRGELERVLAALQQLEESDRAVLVMAAFDDMPYDAIAAAMGLSVAAVKVRVYRARLRLSAALGPAEPEGSTPS